MLSNLEIKDLPTTVPLFPVNGMMLLPRVQIHLAMESKTERELMDDVLRGDRMIGIIQPKTQEGPHPDLYHIGTLGRLVMWAEQDSGASIVGVVGICRFRLAHEFESEKPYRQGLVHYQDFASDLQPPENYQFRRRGLIGQVSDFFVDNHMQVDWEAVERTPDSVLVNTLAMICPFDVVEKQALLEAPTVEKRLQTLEAILTFANTQSAASQHMVH